MLLSSAVLLALISNLSLSLGFPFFMRTYPKSLISYNTIPTFRSGPVLPSVAHLQRPRTQSQPTSKVDNLMFSDEQYVEQRKIDDRDDTSSDETSELQPIYVLPPPNFQPIVYQNSGSDNMLLGTKGPMGNIPLPHPKGFSSFIFGGLTNAKKDINWEQLYTDVALDTPVKAHQPKPVVIYLTKVSQPKGQSKWPSIPIFEAHSVPKRTKASPKVKKTKTQTSQGNNVNAITTNKKGLKTKLPVGMSSFFLGGMRGVSGRHWQMPATMVSQVEFMPNDNNLLTDIPNQKSKPGVQFDDDNDFYNYNVIRDHK